MSARLSLLLACFPLVGARADELDDLVRDAVRDLGSKEEARQAQAAADLAVLGSAARPATAALVALLRHDRADIRLSAARALEASGGLPSEHVPAVAAALADGEAPVRVAAARVLAGATGDVARAALTAAAADGGAELRTEAAFALWRSTGDAEAALPVLLREAAGETASDRHRALRRLGAMGASAAPATAVLTAALRSRVAETRVLAAYALARIRSAERDVVRVMIAGMWSGDDRARLAAQRALGELGPAAAAAVPSLLARRQRTRTAVEALGRIGVDTPTVRKVLEGALDSGSVWLRIHASRAYWRITRDADRSLAAVLPILRLRTGTGDTTNVDLNLDILVAAAGVVGEIAPDDRSALQPLLRHPRLRVRLAAARALRR